MEMLSNDILIEAYIKAKELKLEEDFVAILYEELDCRNLIKEVENGKNLFSVSC